MRIALIVIGGLAALVAIAAAVGAMLPVRHRAGREAIIRVPPDSLFALLTDIERFPEWRSGMKRVERRPPVDGRDRWLEVSGDGEILFEVVEAVPGRRLVTRIADPALPFGGTWTHELDAVAEGTRLTITEDGEVYNPIFRFMSRYVFGHHSTIDRFLKDLSASTGR